MEKIKKKLVPEAETAVLPLAVIWFIIAMFMCSSCTAVRDLDDLNPEAGTGEVLWLNCEQVENNYTKPEDQGYLVNIQFSTSKESGFAQVKYYIFHEGIWKQIFSAETDEPYTEEFTNLRRLQSEEHVQITYNYLTPLEGRYRVEVIVDGSSTKTCEVPVK